jgi:hypothetical protein
MFAVETYAAVRKFVFTEGNSRREAARVFGLSRDTVAKMCRYSAPPGYVRAKPAERPKLGPLVPVIDAILETDRSAPPKQRHTAKRIFERLRDEHGFLGGWVSSQALVRYRTNDYSVPTRYGYRDVLVKGFVDVVVIFCDGAEIARHARSYGHGDRAITSPCLSKSLARWIRPRRCRAGSCRKRSPIFAGSWRRAWASAANASSSRFCG